MGRKRIHASDTARARAWRSENTTMVSWRIRDDATINSVVIKKAAETSGVSQAQFLNEAVAYYILNHEKLGEKWLEENGNKPSNNRDK